MSTSRDPDNFIKFFGVCLVRNSPQQSDFVLGCSREDFSRLRLQNLEDSLTNHREAVTSAKPL